MYKFVLEILKTDWVIMVQEGPEKETREGKKGLWGCHSCNAVGPLL
jgi:hypothetical protein